MTVNDPQHHVVPHFLPSSLLQEETDRATPPKTLSAESSTPNLNGAMNSVKRSSPSGSRLSMLKRGSQTSIPDENKQQATVKKVSDAPIQDTTGFNAEDSESHTSIDKLASTSGTPNFLFNRSRHLSRQPFLHTIVDQEEPIVFEKNVQVEQAHYLAQHSPNLSRFQEQQHQNTSRFLEASRILEKLSLSEEGQLVTTGPDHAIGPASSSNGLSNGLTSGLSNNGLYNPHHRLSLPHLGGHLAGHGSGAPYAASIIQSQLLVNLMANQGGAAAGGLSGIPKKISLYKTELCRTFEETGYCRYGTKCQFAHDRSELRIIPRHPRYKTEICRTFWEHGNCPYGKRCCFIHLEAPGLGANSMPFMPETSSMSFMPDAVSMPFMPEVLLTLS